VLGIADGSQRHAATGKTNVERSSLYQKNWESRILCIRSPAHNSQSECGRLLRPSFLGKQSSPGGSGGTDDHDTADKPDGYNGTDSDVHSSCDGYCSVELPVEEGRRRYFRGDVLELHDAGDDDSGQRVDVRGGGDEHGGNGNQRGGDTDGECSVSSSGDYDAAREPDGDGRADSDIHGSSDGHCSVELPVE
jgi:hypothetical protein